jgi:hypothetical protein
MLGPQSAQRPAMAEVVQKLQAHVHECDLCYIKQIEGGAGSEV